MQRLIILLAVALTASASAQSPPGAAAVALDGHNFTLPAGFTVERAAGPTLISRPISADFDEEGRLYVTEAAGAIEKADIAAQKTPHRVVRLEDVDGDGRFDKSVVYADEVAFPEGAMWLAGSLYVAAPPKIWKFTDGDGDGVAEKREVWFDGKTVTGCANDLHGPYLGPDGWIYWCKGAFAKQDYTLPSGKSFTTRASHIFRARPDGTGIEPVMTGGMDNPVDTVFTPGGERIFSTTFFQRPANGLRDGLIHAVYGGIYGKDQDAIYDPVHKWTSPELMPVLVHHGPSAPCGLHRLESDQFGPEYQDNVFSCQFNLRKVSRHVLKPSGSTFTTEDSDFIVSDNTDFHPTDVIEDADGSLLVLNTGGWYKLCCPSSQLVKDDVLGGIYRVKKVGSHQVKDPWGRLIDWKKISALELQRLFGDRSPYVRKLVANKAVASATGGIDLVRSILTSAYSNDAAMLTAIEVASRKEDPSAAYQVRRGLNAYHHEVVRQKSIHLVSVHRDKEAVPQLIELLSSPSLHNRRAAAEALGRIGDSLAVSALLTALADTQNDRTLDHSLTYALIEIGQEESLRTALKSGEPRVERAALVALDQMEAKIDPAYVIARLDTSNEALRDSARWIAGRHAEWGVELSQYARTRLAALPSDEKEQAQLVVLLAKLAKNETIQKLLTEVVEVAGKSPEAGKVALKAMAASELKELPAAWLAVIVQSLMGDSPVLPELLAAVRAVPPAKTDAPKMAAALIKLGDSAAPAPLRLMALASAPGGLKVVTDNHLAMLLEFIDREQAAEQRGMAADVLAKAKLSGEQLRQLADRLPRVSPMELDRLLGAFVQSTDESVGLLLVSVLDSPELRAALSAEAVKQRLAKYGPSVQMESLKLCAKIDAEHGQQGAQLEATIAALPAGDIRRGQAVFNSTKASCRACHTIGYVGGRIGPDLTRIAQIRQPRELLESVLYPSASFVRHYEPLMVRMLDGQVHSGIVKSETSAEVVLTLAADKEVRLAHEEIDESQVGKVSVMPAGIEKQLSLQDLADLLEFLRNCK